MWVGLLTYRISSKLEKSNLINQHALNRKPVPLSPPSNNSPPFQGKKVNKHLSLWSPLPLPFPRIILHFTVLVYHDFKTWCGLIQDGLFTNWHGCVTPKFSYMYLWFSTLYSSSFGRTETVVFAKKDKTPISNMPPGLFSPAPLPPSNVIEINKSLGGGGDFLSLQVMDERNCFLVLCPLHLQCLTCYWFRVATTPDCTLWGFIRFFIGFYRS